MEPNQKAPAAINAVPTSEVTTFGTISRRVENDAIRFNALICPAAKQPEARMKTDIRLECTR